MINPGRTYREEDVDQKPIQIMLVALRGFLVKSNLIFGTAPLQDYTLTLWIRGTAPNSLNLHEWEAQNPSFFAGNIDADPLFVDEDAANFTPGSGSPLVDKGSFLTTTTTASPVGGGKVVQLDDVEYFSDGHGIPGVTGDTVQFSGQTSTYVIQAVDYSNKTITLDKAATWSNGLGISLSYKDSRPDIGAVEK
jgi:hypothetical protein